MKTLFSFIAIVVLALPLEAKAVAEKIGIVDLPTAIQATKEGKKIKKQLEDEYNKKKADLEKKFKDISTMQADFEKKSLVLSDEARVKKQQEIDGEKTKYMEMREKNLQELAKKDRELSQPMIKKLNEVIGEIAQKEGFTVILHKNEQNLVWAAKEVDITDMVIKALEKNKSIDIDKILEILPHRQPFVLIDRILELVEPEGPTRVGRKVKVLKNVSYNEPYFAGHFPHRAVMPGVLIIESMAQAAAIACWREADPKMDVAIARLSEIRIHRPVIPGDQLIIHAEVTKDRGQIIAIDIKSYVEDELVTATELLASVTLLKK